MKNRNVFEALRNAFDGVIVLASEHAARRELVILMAALILFAFSINVFTIALVTLSLLLLALESLNTAIEEICNYLDHKYDPRIKRIKDLGASAILFLSLAIGFVFTVYVGTSFESLMALVR